MSPFLIVDQPTCDFILKMAWLKTVWVDATLDFEFEGNFEGLRRQIWSKIDICCDLALF